MLTERSSLFLRGNPTYSLGTSLKIMPVQHTCGRCGAPLNASANPQLCPSCLLRAGLIGDVEKTVLDESKASSPVPAADRQDERARTGTSSYFGDYELLEEL